VEHLRSRGYEAPLQELTFATLGQEIYFQHSDGSWEGDLRPDQKVLEKVLHLDPLRARITGGAERRAREAGQVIKKRGPRHDRIAPCRDEPCHAAGACPT
jgi:hypothetical protein